MQKSIFSKYFRVCATVVIASIAVLGSLFITFASNYFSSEKATLLRKNANIARRIVLNTSQINLANNSIQIDSIALQNSFVLFAEATDSVIFMTDMNGNTQICTEGDNCNHKTYQVPLDIRTKATQKGEFFEKGTLGGSIYKSSQYTLGLPITIEDGKEVHQIGYLFISTSAQALNTFLIEMTKIFILSAIAVLLLAFIVVYFATAKMVRPLREMSQAAKNFGKGDFTARINIDSDDEIGQLATSFNNMAKSLSALESMRRSFIANVSHELKTPMTSIAGFVDGILDGTIPKEKQNEYLRIVSDEVKRLSRLVKSMLNLSRIEAGELKIQTTQFNIVETICQTVFSFERQINDKHLDIRGLDQDKVMVEADPDLIHQVVYNLTENAVKFVNDGGYLEFSFTVEGNITYIGIKNSGEGLSKEEIPRVFDRFYKTDKSRGIDKNGVGLGLYIVRSVINLHGGDIIVRSVQGEYTEFVFSIPTAKVKNSALVKGKEKDYNELKEKREKDTLPPKTPGEKD